MSKVMECEGYCDKSYPLIDEYFPRTSRMGRFDGMCHKCRKHHKDIAKRRIEEHKKEIFTPEEIKHRKRCHAIAQRLRSRLSNALASQDVKKTSNVMDLIGCSIDELKDWLEFLFVEGMSWDNRSKWHIDHIKPCVAFDLTNEQQQRDCFNWGNLQPLWAEDNLKKGAKYEKPENN